MGEQEPNSQKKQQHSLQGTTMKEYNERVEKTFEKYGVSYLPDTEPIDPKDPKDHQTIATSFKNAFQRSSQKDDWAGDIPTG
jgi:hypothetical protein